MNKRILIVDDENHAIALFRQMFRQEIRLGEIALEFAHDGEQALQMIAASNPPDIVLILSDIDMPGMNGLDLLAQCKGRWPDLPVMMISTDGDSESGRRAKDLSADDSLTKPLDFVALKEKLRPYFMP